MKMKQTPEIVQIVKDRISEHEKEMEATLAEQDKLKKGLEEEQKKGHHALLLQSNKIMILKDKALFHRACILCLKDILENLK